MSSLPPAVTLIKQDEHPALSESRNRAERPTDRIYVAPPEIVLVALPFSFLLFFLFPPTTHVGGKKKKKNKGGGRVKGAYRHGLAHSQSGQIFLRKTELF